LSSSTSNYPTDENKLSRGESIKRDVKLLRILRVKRSEFKKHLGFPAISPR
jgi:hypothetical protein